MPMWSDLPRALSATKPKPLKGHELVAAAFRAALMPMVAFAILHPIDVTAPHSRRVAEVTERSLVLLESFNMGLGTSTFQMQVSQGWLRDGAGGSLLENGIPLDSW